MSDLFGHTRARVSARHALITPQNHVASAIPGISGATSVVLINPAMGASVAQLLVTFQKGGSAQIAGNDVETFGYVMSGGANLNIGSTKGKCSEGSFFFAPAGESWAISSPKAGTQVTLFQKKYIPLAGSKSPEAFIRHESDVKGTPFLGDPAANLQVLLPDEPSFDMAVNIFAYQPGGHLPFVEIHIMEHGLIFLFLARASTALRITIGTLSKRATLSGWRPIALNGLSLWARHPRATFITRMSIVPPYEQSVS